MVIANEDYQQESIQNGLFLASPPVVPEGFAADLKNYMLHDGLIEGRGSFIPIGYTPSGTDGFLLGGSGSNMISPRIAPYGVQTAAGLGLSIWSAFISGGTPYVYMMLTNSIKRCAAPGAASYYSFLVYNGVTYASVVTSPGIVKLDVTNFPTSITPTNIVGSPVLNAETFIQHKGRLWGAGLLTGSNPNRLYYTDAPAVGGLPETWNTTVNFIDLNHPSEGSLQIRWMVPLGNYIYIFTNKGLYSLYISGGASNWVLKPVNINIKAQSVVTKNGLIYYTSNDGVYVTDGFEFKLISQALPDVYFGPKENFSYLSLFEGGLILESVPSVGYSRYFYTRLESIAWSELTFPTAWGEYPTNSRMVKAHFVEVSSTFTLPASWVITVSDIDNNLVKGIAFKYDPTVQRGDQYPTYNAGVFSSVLVAPIPFILETRDIPSSNWMRTKRWNEFQAMILGQRYWSIVEAKMALNFDANVYQNMPQPPAPPNNANYLGYVARFGAVQTAFAARFRLFIQATDNSTLNTNPGVPLRLGSIGYTTLLGPTAQQGDQIYGQ